ncbi:Anthranilate synthase component I and chorismate binding enzyme [Prochlorococcus marinus str. MIT 9515]|uniref:Anthranilate synthase component 1 n=1 Tax=Prochlorococcus marinus (strain MIT 9515) TaxID=167542 RepID=A2BYW0_PROM5|nr:anthranilate synthase component I family protein [Prochlorococcus marinus]ABM72971.1 Anthranilate synthase component I and chorismate binding enzyme [Prochlorococcus marinus str. MIT 9515]
MSSSQKDIFYKAYKEGKNFIPLIKTWPADLETPLSTWLKLSNENSHGVFLESVEGGENVGRWSIVAVNPLWEAVCHGKKTIKTWSCGKSTIYNEDPFDLLKTWTEEYKSYSLENLPYIGQLYGSWGYELINYVEPNVPINELEEKEIPYGSWMFFDQLVIFDQMKRCITAVVYADTASASASNIERIYKDSILKIDTIRDLMRLPLKETEVLNWNESRDLNIEISSNWNKKEFEDAVVSAKEYIKKGDIFQIVISQKFQAKVKSDPFNLYRSLRMVNPSPYMAFFDFGTWYLIGSSPEVMVKAEKNKNNQIVASLRPIAGTRPKGKDAEQDLKFEEELLSDPKEISEHVMLIDLGRNDLGRVCETGTVEVKDLMIIEKYSHVMHIVSEVEGVLKKNKGVWDLFKACFPAGTVTGAPKIRAMQLIKNFEKDARGPYAGVYGSIDINGALNTAITIRTMIVKPSNEGEYTVSVQAGAGIVADSSPVNEYQETINKAKGILMSLACLDR